jgi:hypothetical protein
MKKIDADRDHEEGNDDGDQRRMYREILSYGAKTTFWCV